ncbi:MAG: alpha/beta hydrolase [Alphaproteobacteria bacterium]|nr:alpha/beta hydrolase [Alphaproteobacteria bacterium]
MTARPAVAEPAPVPYRPRHVRAQDGCGLFVRDYPAAPGAGPKTPVLCLSGIARTSADFDALARRLAARGHRVIAPDYRGRGRSERSPDPDRYRPEVYLDDLRHAVTALDVAPMAVVGTSLGGGLAMALGVALPTRLRAVVINDIGPDVPTDGVGRVAGYIASGRSYADWEEATAALQELTPDLNPGPGETARPEDWRRAAEATYHRADDGRLHPNWDPAIARPLLRGDPPPDLWPLFASLRRLPCLVIRGGRSDILSAETLERMEAAHPRLRTLTLPTKGHAPTLDEPQSLEAVDELLETLA